MAKTKKENPLTLNEFTKYNQKVLFPFMKENFVTKNEFESFLEIAATRDDLKKMEERLDKKIEGIATKEDIKNLGKQLSVLSEDLKKSNNIEMRVDYIENVLAIKK
jgi:primase-polymerase (primpol)-like protein